MSDFINPKGLLFGTSEQMMRIIKESDNTYLNKYEDNRLKFDGACTYIEFISYIDKIIKILNENRNDEILFTSYKGEINDKDVKLPAILYSVNSREPEEIKPRVRQTIKDKVNESNYLTIYGQRFRYYIDFSIVADTYEKAEEIMEFFEDLMSTYTGFFMSKGVADIRFVKQTSDTVSSAPEKYFIKTIRYSVVLEKITAVSIEAMQKIIASIQL